MARRIPFHHPVPEAGEEAFGILAEMRQVEAADLGVDQGRPPRRQGGGERLLEVVLSVDRITVGAAGVGKGDIVGIVERDQRGLFVDGELRELDQGSPILLAPSCASTVATSLRHAVAASPKV